MLNNSLLVKKKKDSHCPKNFRYRRHTSLLKKVQTASGANPASFNGYPGLFEGVKRQGSEVTTCLHLVLRLKMSGAVPLLPIYTFMARTGKNLPCILYRNVSSSNAVQANLNILFLYDTLQLFFPMYTYQAVSLQCRFCVFVLFCFIGVLVLDL